MPPTRVGADAAGTEESLLAFNHPLTIAVKRLPASRLLVHLSQQILLLRLTTETNHRRITLRILYRPVQNEMILTVYLIPVRQQLRHQRCPRLPIFRELTGRQEQTRRPIAQHIMIIHLLTRQLRHRHRIHLRRRRLTTAQQLARILTILTRTAKILTEPASLQLHIRAALLTLDHRTIIPFDLE